MVALFPAASEGPDDMEDLQIYEHSFRGNKQVRYEMKCQPTASELERSLKINGKRRNNVDCSFFVTFESK